jgi:hypothetical protein
MSGIRGTQPYEGVYSARPPQEWEEGSDLEIAHLLEEALKLIEEGSTLYAQGLRRHEAVRAYYGSLDRTVKSDVLRMALEMILLEATLANLEMRLGLVCSLVGSFLFEETLKYRHGAARKSR